MREERVRMGEGDPGAGPASNNCGYVFHLLCIYSQTALCVPHTPSPDSILLLDIKSLFPPLLQPHHPVFCILLALQNSSKISTSIGFFGSSACIWTQVVALGWLSTWRAGFHGYLIHSNARPAFSPKNASNPNSHLISPGDTDIQSIPSGPLNWMIFMVYKHEFCRIW